MDEMTDPTPAPVEAGETIRKALCILNAKGTELDSPDVIALLPKADAALTAMERQVEGLRAERDAFYTKAIEYEHELYGDPGHTLGLKHIVDDLKAALQRVEGERDAWTASAESQATALAATIDQRDTLQQEVGRLKESLAYIANCASGVDDARNQAKAALGTP